MFSVLCSNGLYLLMAVKHRLMFAIEGGKQLSYLEHCLEQAMLFIKRLFEKLIVSVTIFIEKNLSFLKNQRVHLILTHLQKFIAVITDAPFLLDF